MSAVKPTAEDYEKAIAEVGRDPYNSALYTGAEAIRRIKKLAASLASHRQPESDFSPKRLAASIDKLTEIVRMPNIEYVADEHNDAVKLLRAYAKLLRGERE